MQINLPKTALKGPVSFEWKIPQWSNTIERNRARTYFQAYAAACALHFAEKALVEIRAGRTKTWEKFEVPDEGIGCGFTEAVRGVLSHHMVIRDGKIANYHPYPPTPWNANPRDTYGTPGPYEDAVQGQPIFEENDREHFKGIDIMRTVRSFDPCLPCGVHMYLGGGKTLETAALAHPVRHRRVTLADAETEHEPDARAARDRRADRGAARGQRGRRRGGPGAGRGTGPAGRRPLRRRPGADADDPARGRPARRRAARPRWPPTTWWPACCWCTACIRTTSPTRVEQALDSVRPYLGSHGGDVELLEVTADGVVRLRLLGSCDGCASSAVTLKLAVEGAIEAAAPEIIGIEVETAPRAPQSTAGPVISVDSLRPGWTSAEPTGGRPGRRSPELAGLAAARLAGFAVAGPVAIVGCRLGSDLYAYRDHCGQLRRGAWPGRTLGRRLGGAAGDAVLRCPSCGAHFEVRQAGRRPGRHRRLHLEPAAAPGRATASRRVAVPGLGAPHDHGRSTPLAVLAPGASAARPAAGRRASAARCAPSRSPTSTRTSSTSRAAA